MPSRRGNRRPWGGACDGLGDRRIGVSGTGGLLALPPLWVCIALAASTPAAADPLLEAPGASVLDLTLEDAVRLALERNRSLLDRRLDREAGRLSLEVAEDRWTPRVTVGSFASRDQHDRRAGVGIETGLRVPTGGAFALRWDESLSSEFDDGGSRTFSFSQPLLKGAGTDIDSAPVRQARIGEKRDILGFRRAAEDLIVTVTDAYRSLSRAVRQVEIGEASLRRAHGQLEATRALIRAGRVARREAGRSEVAVANRELSLTRARNRLEAAQFALIDILELDSRVRIRPLEVLQPPSGESVAGRAFDAAFEEALGRRADYLQARLRVESAEIALAVTSNDLLPDLSLRFEWNRDNAGRNNNEVRLDATVPLNDREPALARLRARHEIRKAERGLLELRESIGIELRRVMNDVEVGRRLTELARNARELAEGNLEVERAKFGQGLSSAFEVAASEDELVGAEEAEVEAIVAWLGALTQLDRVSGQVLDRWGIRLEAVPE